MKLRLRAAAVRDLDGIFDYSLTAHGVDAAQAYIRDLEAVMDRLLEFSESGTATSLRPGIRSAAAREHRIYYRVEQTELVVVRVLHKAMDVDRHL